MSIVQALLLGLLGGIGIWDSRVGGIWMIDRPLVLGPLVGLILGDFTTGIIVGGSLELIMMGVVGIGSATPPDTVSGTILATAFAIVSKLDVSAAVALALPIASLGQVVGILVRTANGFFVHMADKYAEEGNTRQITLCNVLYPTLLSFFMRFPIPFLANLYGADAVKSFMDTVPQWIIHGFSVAGGLLPALGFALTMFVIGRKELLPWFFIGYFMIRFSGMPVIGAAIFGLCAVLLITMYKRKSEEA